MSDAEWEIMRVVWAQGQTSSKAIITILSQEKGWSASTIKTFLSRLVDKGYLWTERQGKAFVYRANLSEEQAQISRIRSVLDTICLTKHQPLLAQILEETPLTEPEINQLVALLLSKKERVPKEVRCTCIKGQCACANQERSCHA